MIKLIFYDNNIKISDEGVDPLTLRYNASDDFDNNNIKYDSIW